MASPVTEAPFVLFEDEVPAHQDLRVVARTPGIDLSIRPGAARHVGIEVATRPDVDSRLVETLIRRLNVSIHEEDETVIVETASPFRSQIGEWRSFAVPVQVRLFVPNDLRIEARSSGGTIEVVGLKGRFDLEVNGGTMRIEDVEGPMNIRSRASLVRLRYCGGREITLDAAASRLEGHALDAAEIHMKLRACDAVLDRVSGAVSINASHGTLDVRTLKGKVEVLAKRTPIALAYERSLPTVVYASAADVAVQVDMNEEATLHLEGARTSLSSQFPFTGEADGQLVEGQLGDGGPLIYVASTGGNVSLEPAG